MSKNKQPPSRPALAGSAELRQIIPVGRTLFYQMIGRHSWVMMPPGMDTPLEVGESRSASLGYLSIAEGGSGGAT